MRTGVPIAVAVLLSWSVAPALAQLQLTPQVPRQSSTSYVRPAVPNAEGEAARPAPRAPARLPRQSGTASTEAQTRGNFPRRLDQRAIRERFVDGQPIASRALGGQIYTLTFFPDGRLERISPQGETTKGRWRFQGDAYCSRWDGNRAETCHTIVEEGTTVRVVRNTRAVATWTRPTEQAAVQQ
jgi:hypothetical protein